MHLLVGLNLIFFYFPKPNSEILCSCCNYSWSKRIYNCNGSLVCILSLIALFLMNPIQFIISLVSVHDYIEHGAQINYVNISNCVLSAKLSIWGGLLHKFIIFSDKVAMLTEKNLIKRRKGIMSDQWTKTLLNCTFRWLLFHELLRFI